MPREAEAKQAVKARVSHETFERLEAYAALLIQWQKRINLISPTTIPVIWSRHVLDSVQIVDLAQGRKLWLDIGSGGGLPGLVVACMLAEIPEARIDLVESNAKKGAFLQHVAAQLLLPAQVHVQRIEAAISQLATPEVISARALASLDDLLGFCNLLLKRGAIGLFPKGQDFENELTAARKNWHFMVNMHPSITDARARILEIAMPQV